MKKLTQILFALLLGTNAHSQDCGQTFTGEGTYYGYGGGGNCSYPDPSSPVYTGAMNELQYDTSMTCGACIEVTGNKGSLIIRIEDRCPECKYGDIDLSEEAFPFIDDKINGRVPISWKFVPCPVQGAVKFYFKEGSSQWWTAVQVRNHKYPITKLEYKVDGQWVNVPRQMYNYFLVDHPGMGPGPYSFRITDMYGDVIEENNIPLLVTTEIDGQNQFPDCSGSTIVPVTGVSLPDTSVNISFGSSAQLTASVLPADATDKSLTWNSSDTEIATVNPFGSVMGISAGTTTITVTTNDGGYTGTATVIVSENTDPSPCTDPQPVEIPFSFSGTGDYCFVTTTEMANVNSWNTDLIEINGVDFTNKWSGDLPPAQNGEWIIHYIGNSAWSHFEAPQAKTVNMGRIVDTGELLIYPNPFTDRFTIDPENYSSPIYRVEVINTLGQVVKDIPVDQPGSISVNLESKTGIYLIRIHTAERVILKTISKY